MERHEVLLGEANRHFDIADHMLYMTYPLLNDKKAIITIAENLYKAVSKGVDAVLNYDYLYKRISELPEAFEEKIDVFKQIMKRYNFNWQLLAILKDLRELFEHRKQSAIEFARREHYVFADRNYKLKMISIDKVKEYDRQARDFLQQTGRVLGYDRRIGR